MPKTVWSADLNGYILKLNLMEWDRGVFPTEGTKSAPLCAGKTASRLEYLASCRSLMSERLPSPTEERKAWRRACPAYREMREAGAGDQEAREQTSRAAQEGWSKLESRQTLSPAQPAITRQGLPS